MGKLVNGLVSCYICSMQEQASRILRIHPKDNVAVALVDLPAGSTQYLDSFELTLPVPVAAKHKLALHDLPQASEVYMYGVLVGKTTLDVLAGECLGTHNLAHAAAEFHVREIQAPGWEAPDVRDWEKSFFMGFHRPDGRVGTSNYWVVVPLVFCENRNLQVLKDALVDELGYGRVGEHCYKTRQLAAAFQNGASAEELLKLDFSAESATIAKQRVFPNVDGVRFLTHDGGCGGTRQDAEALCALLAGYIAHPNVAGATVFSLGCQHAQISMLQDALRQRMADGDKPVVFLEQQTYGTEAAMMDEAIRQTFVGMAKANTCKRAPAPLSALSIGLECGGSDGFSGISANPVLGYVSDKIVALGGQVILSEFPELCGVEQELCDRCVTTEAAQRFKDLMQTYQARAVAAGSGFDRNPSPGNIRDGLITDAIKSAGAAKKGGNSPVQGVWDYGEVVKGPGLHLLCTPGNDVESTTAEVGSGANLVLFTTGLGTPTGNPIAPVIKVSSNSTLADKMPDIIDFNAGTVIDGEETIAQAGDRLLRYLIQVASGQIEVAAVRKDQCDFIPWKRGVSL